MTVSIGVAVFLVMRAGAGGCRVAEPDVEAETRPGASVEDPEYFPGTKANTKLVRPSAPTSRYAEPAYFPGSKADPHIVRTDPTSPPGTTLVPSASAGAQAPQPHFFPGTKALDGDVVDPDPAPGGGR